MFEKEKSLKSDTDKNVKKDNAVKDSIIDDSIIVVYKEGAEDLSDKSIKNEIGLVSEEEITRLTGKKMVLLRTKKNSKTEQQKIIERLKKDPNVESAFPDVHAEPCSVLPNNPLFRDQVGYMDAIEAPWAWDKIRGTDTIGGDQNAAVVAVIDSGIDLYHEAFCVNDPNWSSNIWRNPNVNPQLPEDKQDKYGYNFDNDNNDLADATGHGTAVAGVLGAKGNNGKGMSGIAWNIKMAPLKAAASSDSMCKAIDYATQKGFPIICLSQGFYDKDEIPPPNLDKLRLKIEGYPGLFVVAAGNGNKDLDEIDSFSYPAKFGCYNMIVVGGVGSGGIRWTEKDQQGNIIQGSNYGSFVDIYAPAKNILRPIPGGDHKQYGFLSGTSMATPIVAGAAAMLYANGMQFLNDMDVAKGISALKKYILDQAEISPEGNKILNIAKLFPYKDTTYSIPVQKGGYMYRLHDDTVAKDILDANDRDREKGGQTFNWTLREHENEINYRLISASNGEDLFYNMQELQLDACWDGDFVLNIPGAPGPTRQQVTCDTSDTETEKPVFNDDERNEANQRWKFIPPVWLSRTRFRVELVNGKKSVAVKDPEARPTQTDPNVVVPRQNGSAYRSTFTIFKASSTVRSETGSLYDLQDTLTGKYLKAPASEKGDVIVGEYDYLSSGTQWDITSVGNDNYLIESKMYPDKVLTISQDGSRIILDKYKDPQKQLWKIQFDDNHDYFGTGTYKFITYSGKVLDISNPFPPMLVRGGDGLRINESSWSGISNQTWSIQCVSDGYKIINRGTGLLATINRNDMTVYQSIEATGDDKVCQRWDVIPNGDCTFSIGSKALKGLVFNISSGSMVATFRDSSNKAQRFSIEQAIAGNINYSLVTRADNVEGYVVDIPDANLSEGVLLAQSPWKGTPAQIWLLELDPNYGGYYRIVNRNSGLVMSIEDSDPSSDPCRVVQRRFSGGINQLWSISSNYDGTFRLEAAWNKQILALFIYKAASAYAIPWTGSAYQCFGIEQTFASDETYSYRLQIKSSGKVLEVPGASTSERTQLGEYDCNGTRTQMWMFKPLYGGYYGIYGIINKNSGLCMNIDSNMNIVQSPYYGLNSQLWWVISNGDGTFHLQSKAGLVLDMSSGKACATTTWSGSDATRVNISLAIENGIYRIKHKAANQSIDLDLDDEAKERMQLFESKNIKGQKWKITAVNNGYIIESVYKPGKAAWIDSGSGDLYSVIAKRFSENPYDGTLWQFEREVDGNYKIVSSSNNNYVFTPYDKTGQKGTTVGIGKRYTNLKCQKQWVLEKLGDS